MKPRILLAAGRPYKIRKSAYQLPMFSQAAWLRILFALLFCSLGCSAKRPVKGRMYDVGPECHPHARMTGCNEASPPKCSRIALAFDKGCEQIAVK